jgi:uncharacterized protein (UPF0335 family)
MEKEKKILISILSNSLKVYIDFVERLESTTKDKETAEKIRKFLKEQKEWN